VTGLRNDVSISDIRRHFTNCTKVTIKRHRTTPHLKYALYILFTTVLIQYLFLRYAVVCHCTSQEAERNLQRPVNYHRLGATCRVEYARDHSNFSDVHQNFDKKKVVVRQIPENVSENDFRRLFTSCHVLRYRPARIVHLAATTTHLKSNSKILLGYKHLVS
jgi:hypothetical protein